MDFSSKRARVDLNPSEQEDARLFASFDSDHVTPILGLVGNGHGVTALTLKEGEWGETASRRLGDIISRNNRLTSLTINSTVDVDVTGLCSGLQNNKSITRLIFRRMDLSDTVEVSSLASFLTDNPSLREIMLRSCLIGSDGLHVLSSALSSRPGNTPLCVDLSGSPFGDSTLDDLVGALCRCSQLICLHLANCDIGPAACSSLAPLLEGPDAATPLTNRVCHSWLDC